MKVLITGASGYIGQAVAKVLVDSGHRVSGLARSVSSAAKLRAVNVTPISGDFNDHVSLTEAIAAAAPDALISTASVGTIGGDANTFAKDRDAVGAMLKALGKSGRILIFTSGSAVAGVFNGGLRSDVIYDEDATMPLAASAFAPPGSGVHPMLIDGFGRAMAARIETEKAVLAADGVNGIVVRPGLVYGYGGSYDIPALITMARSRGYAPYLGAGHTSQSYVHLDELADLFRLAVEKAPRQAVLHGVVDEVSQRELAIAVSGLIGDRVESVTMNDMLGLNAAERIAFFLTKGIPANYLRSLQRPAPPSLAAGISLSLNKRLSSAKTQQQLGWSPNRRDILADLVTGSYARPV
ncbi:MAG TPA: NAD-dependent epimerase/dehydratase family protein [Steroidobacteraceae bacterium]